MTRLIYFVAGLACVVCIRPAMAQVAVTPHSVDAPYVHVDWWGGRVHVCAPFVDLYTNWPGCCQPKPCCGEQAGVTGDSAASVAGQPIAMQLAKSGEKLYDSLGRFRTAQMWQQFLAVAPGGALTGEQLQHRGSSQTADLKATLENFDSARSDKQYDMISSLPAFEQTRSLLARYLEEHPMALTAATNPPSAGPNPQPEIARHWSPASKQPGVGLPGLARDIARPSVEELPLPSAEHANIPAISDGEAATRN